MQVYKAFFKVLGKNLSQIMIYVVVFLSVTISLSQVYTDPAGKGFMETKIDIAFVDHDNSRFSEGLKDYLGANANIINIKDDTQKLQDALFFRRVEYIVTVPEGFTEGFLSGKEVQLDRSAVPDSASAICMDNLLNKYLNTAKTYNSSIKGLGQEQLVSMVANDMSQKAEVVLKGSKGQKFSNQKYSFFYNYLAYAVLAVLILGVSTVMIVFNDDDLKKRNLCSPLKLRNMNFQMILGNITFALVSWVIMIMASFIMFSRYMFTPNGLLLLLNSLVFTISALGISFLIGNSIKSRGAISAASNVVSLGSCFISGVFVPQAYLGKTVLTIASFTPTYWYVKSNNAIVNIVSFSIENLRPIFINMLIVLGFAAAALTVALALTKQRRVSA